MSSQHDPFWAELEAAYNAVATHPEMEVTVQRGDKEALVKYVPEREAIYAKITLVPLKVTDIELNPLAKKESDTNG